MTPKQEKYLIEKYIRPMVKEMLKEGTWALNKQKIPEVIKTLQEFKRTWYDIIGDDIFFDNVDACIDRAKELLNNDYNT